MKFPKASLLKRICLLVMLAVETAQLLTLLGSFDVDDLILNLFGMILGYLFCIANSRK